MTTLIVPGTEDATPRRSVLAEYLSPDTVHTEHSVHAASARDGGGEEVFDVADDRVVEIELENGTFLWTRADDLARDLACADVSCIGRGGASAGVRVPIELPFGTRSRGLGAWVLKGLKILGVDIAGTITDFVTDKVEGRLDPGPGLYRCGTNSPTELLPVGTLDPAKPVLVFLHGTFSSTEGSFGNLWNEGEHGIGKLIESYDGQVLALQHRTASLSPIRNALDLLVALEASSEASTGEGRRPTPWRLHLVSHSRGGLIGELLCRGAAVDLVVNTSAAPVASYRCATGSTRAAASTISATSATPRPPCGCSTLCSTTSPLCSARRRTSIPTRGRITASAPASPCRSRSCCRAPWAATSGWVTAASGSTSSDSPAAGSGSSPSTRPTSRRTGRYRRPTVGCFARWRLPTTSARSPTTGAARSTRRPRSSNGSSRLP